MVEKVGSCAMCKRVVVLSVSGKPTPHLDTSRELCPGGESTGGVTLRSDDRKPKAKK